MVGDEYLRYPTIIMVVVELRVDDASRIEELISTTKA